MDDLINYDCVDFKKLLILRAKNLKINDQECYMLLLIMTMDEIGMKPIIPSMISKLCSMSLKDIDKILISLVDRHLILREKGSLNFSPLKQILLNQPVKEIQDLNLVSIFENAFGRALNQMELEIINGFKTSGYDDKMILDALNESVKSGVINFRYIEKILDNWSKYGVRKRFTSSPIPENQDLAIDQKIKDLKWWMDDD